MINEYFLLDLKNFFYFLKDLFLIIKLGEYKYSYKIINPPHRNGVFLLFSWLFGEILSQTNRSIALNLWVPAVWTMLLSISASGSLSDSCLATLRSFSMYCFVRSKSFPSSFLFIDKVKAIYKNTFNFFLSILCLLIRLTIALILLLFQLWMSWFLQLFSLV